jgi:regulator of protease activity HflC (stomatin/prohibitin superfamily)
MKNFRILFVILMVLSLSGCDLPVQQLGARERGVVFRRLPTFLGGGVATSVHPPGALVVVWPWDSIYRIDTGSRDVSLGEAGLDGDLAGFVFTRAKDGNEVALRMTVRYRVGDSEDTLVRLIQEVTTTDEALQQIIVAISRATIRLYMNELRTSGFLGEQDRYKAIEKVKNGVQKELDTLLPGGVEIQAMMIDRFEFARLGPTGDVDRSYQEKLNEVLRLIEDSEREKLRIKTVRAEGERREFETQAQVNRLIQEGLGAKNQAESRGESYLTSRENEARSVLAVGKAEVQGLIERINALEGPGGAAILKLELANALRQSDPRFVLMGSGGGDKGIDVQRTDTNELINQLGVFEALSAKTDSAASTQTRPQGKEGVRAPEVSKPALPGAENAAPTREN